MSDGADAMSLLPNTSECYCLKCRILFLNENYNSLACARVSTRLTVGVFRGNAQEADRSGQSSVSLEWEGRKVRLC